MLHNNTIENLNGIAKEKAKEYVANNLSFYTLESSSDKFDEEREEQLQMILKKEEEMSKKRCLMCHRNQTA